MAELCFLTNVSGEQWAAWAQAILSGVAIFASVLVVNHQHQLELKREAASDRKRAHQYLKSTFQLIGAVYQVTLKVKTWAEADEPHERAALMGMEIELEGLIDALKQTDFGRFDEHLPIEAVSVTLTVARLMVRSLTSGPGDAIVSTSDIIDIGGTADIVGQIVKERLDKIHAAFPSDDVKY